MLGRLQKSCSICGIFGAKVTRGRRSGSGNFTANTIGVIFGAKLTRGFNYRKTRSSLPLVDR